MSPRRRLATTVALLLIVPAPTARGDVPVAAVPARRGAPVSVAVDPALDRAPISDLVYGVSFPDAASAVDYPFVRWGGNSTTRYSWTEDISNKAADWFFMNIPGEVTDPNALPFGSSSDQFVTEHLGAGREVLLTIPTIGWIPTQRVKRWGFSVQKYGAQQQTECTATGNAPWCMSDAGNGLDPGGTPITGNDPGDTSVAVDPTYVTDWLAHLTGQFGGAADGGVRYLALDNEPMLWNSTHRDVHPDPLGYDDLWSFTQAYGAALKAADPDVVVFGPVEWGWCSYFGSAIDAADGGSCMDGSDRQAHGGVPLLEWYLQQVCDYEAMNGVRLVDVLDVHYYPQAAGVGLSDDESAGTAALRLRSVKDLYDPSYVSESWIGEPVMLLPRLRAWIDSACPGTRLALTEYNWGGDDGASSALAQAEILAILGRERVDTAARWVAPAPGTKVEEAFRLYLDYDGAGSRVRGDTIRATSSDVDAVGSYAVIGGDDTLYVLLFNKSEETVPATTTVAAAVTGPATVWQFTATTALAAAGTAAVAADAFTLDLPPRSATLAVLQAPGQGGGTTSGSGSGSGSGGSGGTSGTASGTGTGGSASATAGSGGGGSAGTAGTSTDSAGSATTDSADGGAAAAAGCGCATGSPAPGEGFALVLLGLPLRRAPRRPRRHGAPRLRDPSPARPRAT